MLFFVDKCLFSKKYVFYSRNNQNCIVVRKFLLKANQPKCKQKTCFNKIHINLYLVLNNLFFSKKIFFFLTGLLSILYNICQYMLNVLVVHSKRPKISKTQAGRLYHLLSRRIPYKKKSLHVDILCF